MSILDNNPYEMKRISHDVPKANTFCFDFL